jgi:hypothetical protein
MGMDNSDDENQIYREQAILDWAYDCPMKGRKTQEEYDLAIKKWLKQKPSTKR